MKKLLFGIVIGMLAGLWMGANLGKGQAIWENPFQDNSLQGRLERSQRDLGEAFKDGADAIRDAVK
ncbi:hypothetical protein MIB92_09240 [Aestuariirhabdus sp. Z084]|uniref:hypothetical protein n=1 Tax=Aestuariirhabdus haliotis TaxID=2918751 RepID=UPI00201B406E|nr:hypothetical protein [Aestuariirhabdus haliotis]MCL6415836.1 hypothetical protein [Aestuariirhabdus haliotis]MCL6419862.1 hypothetical protein [Aestuariirhabdus haliotis]